VGGSKSHFSNVMGDTYPVRVNLRELITRVQVDTGVKVFNVGDEFLLHAFKAHLTSGVLTQLQLGNSSNHIAHAKTHEWLHDTAQSLAQNLLMPQSQMMGNIIFTPASFTMHSCTPTFGTQ
jgi:hypothetical protein